MVVSLVCACVCRVVIVKFMSMWCGLCVEGHQWVFCKCCTVRMCWVVTVECVIVCLVLCY